MNDETMLLDHLATLKWAVGSGVDAARTPVLCGT